MYNENPFELIVHLLAKHFQVEYTIDPPFEEGGEWWIDLNLNQWKTSAVWKDGQGFGLFTSDDVFGQRPDEIFHNQSMAAARLKSIAEKSLSNEPTEMTLKDIRHLFGESQQTMADRLATGQAEVSRFEARGNVRIERSRQYIEALGGKLEMIVTFDDFRSPIALPVSDEQDSGSNRAPRARGKRAHA